MESTGAAQTASELRIVLPLAGATTLKYAPSTKYQCISYLACHCDKICDKSNLREGEFISSQFTGHSP